MILICLGGSEHNFDRLLKIIDELCDERILNGVEIICQRGSTKYIPRNYQSFVLIGREEFQEYMEQADLIISHAGTGSVIPSLKLGKKVIVFPRREKYKEHLDDHQLELRDAFVNSGYALGAENKKELVKAIEESKTFKPKVFKSNNERMNQLIINFIESV